MSPAPSIVLSTMSYTDGTLGSFTTTNVATVDATYDFLANIAIYSEPRASVNWNEKTRPINLDQVPVAPVTYTASRMPIWSLEESPFFVDTGANTHILPERTDFKTLRPISPHAITRLGGSCIFAVGIRTIHIHIAGGHKLILNNVLFAPASTVRLVSVLLLNNTSGCYTSCFGHDSSGLDCFWLMNSSGVTILYSSVHKERRLYYLSLSRAKTTHSRSKTGESAASNAHTTDTTSFNTFHASCIPDIETWHRCLGYCNFGAIVDMARKHTVEGMMINLSSSPPKYDACFRGKQTHTPVSKVREGEKAKRPLECVFVDLCGLIRPLSSSGKLYSMNIIDDFSSYVWTVPLSSKGEAAPSLQNWHCAVENQLGHCLKILISDNGELVSQSMAEWCAEFGVDHQRTAPYTSAQNGRAERLHWTILDKAHAMLISCKALHNLWDEFCATSAYLTNLTPSSSLQGRMPFELWYGRKPSLSHLREIGCCAFAFIPTATPKTYTRSRPCTLIGYSPHSKAYQLWDRESGHIFDSFHVSFLEHLDECPTDLFPGMTLTLTPDSPPSWDTASTPPSHKNPSPIPCSLTYPPTIPNLDIPKNNTIITTEMNTNNEITPTIPPSISIPTIPPSIPPTIPPSLPHMIPPSHDISVIPPLRRSSRTQFSSAREVTNDGLLLNSRLASVISDSAASSAHMRTTCSSRLSSVPEAHLSTFIDDLPSYDFTHAFLLEFSDFHNTHDLLPLNLPPGCDLPLDVFLSDVETGSFEPRCDTDNDPSWQEALVSPEREYWIAGACDELRSLQDLQVFVLVPCSSVPSGRRLLKGKLVCKRKRDDTGKITWYKVHYVAKGFAQQPGIDFTKTTAPTTRLESF